MGALLRVVNLEGVGFNDAVIGGGAIGCFVTDGEDSAMEEGPAVQVDVRFFFLLSFRNSLRFLSFSNFSKLSLYFNHCSLIFSV